HRLSGVSISDGRDPRQCSDLTMEFEGQPAERAEQALSVPVASGRPFRVETAVHSGVRIRGTDRADFQVLLCKGAPDASILPDITASEEGGRLTVRGPASDDWFGYLLVEAPRGASVDVVAINGPIGLTGLAGRVTVRSENGPISLSECTGEIDAEASNGPIAVHGDGGKVRLETRNGPISVSLTGSAWSGAGLEAHAVNGPVSLAVPAAYRSGTVVESLGHSPFQCRGGGCGSVRRTWDDDHKRLEFGDGPVVMRLSTENGPVSVKTNATVGDEDDDDD
ncbi:MAG: hypothetical protein ACM3NW_09360, partial [Syntrophomonadaceae bacterium]